LRTPPRHQNWQQDAAEHFVLAGARPGVNHLGRCCPGKKKRCGRRTVSTQASTGEQNREVGFECQDTKSSLLGKKVREKRNKDSIITWKDQPTPGDWNETGLEGKMGGGGGMVKN